jgi:hypothetical protein
MADRTLHRRLYATAITTPAATTTHLFPQSTPLSVPLGVLVSAELVIPTGHAGVTGFSLELSGALILPFDEGLNWIVGDGDVLDYALGIQVDTGLVALTYNEGFYDHSHYVRLTVEDLPALAVAASVSTGPILAADLAPGG